MKRRTYVLVVLLVAAALLTACGGGASGEGGTTSGGTAPTTGAVGESPTTAAGVSGAGDAAAGETLFAEATIGSNPGCKTCHSLDGTQLVGPTMQGMGPRAATRVEGQSAQEYLHASIVDPNVHIVEGYAEGVMPSFRTVLNDQQVNDLVAYLLTLR